MKNYRSLFILLICACTIVSHPSLSADYIVYPAPIIYRDFTFATRFGESSGDGVFYLIVKTIIDSIDQKKFCCALLGMMVAVIAHNLWPDGQATNHMPEYFK